MLDQGLWKCYFSFSILFSSRLNSIFLKLYIFNSCYSLGKKIYLCFNSRKGITHTTTTMFHPTTYTHIYSPSDLCYKLEFVKFKLIQWVASILESLFSCMIRAEMGVNCFRQLLSEQKYVVTFTCIWISHNSLLSTKIFRKHFLMGC